ncbi:MAG TPA: outer membrane beta-barrel protein [Candidatus Polarisedimenticolaceae bacterium]|nr:outer membrane beta-barrel protein [Candidatus Polarisedimenticolaceae bacterium]
MIGRIGMSLATLLVAAPALAVDVDRGLYLGASGGRTQVEADTAGLDFGAGDHGWKAAVGCRLMKFLAVEVNWVDLGSAEDTVGGARTEFSADGWDVSVLGIVPLGQRFEVFARYGKIKWDSTLASANPVLNSEADGKDRAYGIGGAFRIFDSLQVRAEYERYDIGSADRTELATVGVTFTF